MRQIVAWMLVAVVLTPLLTGCEDKGEEGVAVAPDQTEPLPAFPEDQVPPLEPQPAGPKPLVESASPPAEAYAPPVDTTATAANEVPAVTARPLPKDSYAPPVKKAPRTYVVKKGDTLQKISKRFYGTTKKWRMLYNVNRDVLIKGHDFLQVGMKLKIP